jgi:hypothetical protein
MNLKDLQKPLDIADIDFRVQSINKGGFATILAYKDARVDINRLNDVCGVLGWKREHTRENKNCIVSIWNDEIKQWVSKEDTGTESMAEAQKGLASDSFKRSCFNFGIGIELYDYPVIQIKLNANEFKIITANGQYKEKVQATWDLKLKEWIWSSEFKEGKLCKISCKDEKGNARFNWNNFPIKPEEINPIKVVDNSVNKLPFLDVDSKAWKGALSKGTELNVLRGYFRISKENAELYDKALIISMT